MALKGRAVAGCTDLLKINDIVKDDIVKDDLTTDIPDQITSEKIHLYVFVVKIKVK